VQAQHQVVVTRPGRDEQHGEGRCPGDPSIARRPREERRRQHRGEAADQQDPLRTQYGQQRDQTERAQRRAGQIPAVQALDVARVRREEPADGEADEEEGSDDDRVEEQEPRQLLQRLFLDAREVERDRVEGQRQAPQAEPEQEARARDRAAHAGLRGQRPQHVEESAAAQPEDRAGDDREGQAGGEDDVEDLGEQDLRSQRAQRDDE
jgi:hypothetical protein